MKQETKNKKRINTPKKNINLKINLEKLSQEEYSDIQTAVNNMLRDYGTQWKHLSPQEICPQHQEQTRLLSCQKKTQNTSSHSLRQK